MDRNVTYYNIIRKPVEVSFLCPCCRGYNSIPWRILTEFEDETDIYNGYMYPQECTHCGKIIEFDECILG